MSCGFFLCYSCINCWYQNGVNEGESPVCFVVSRNKITDLSAEDIQKWVRTNSARR